MHFDVFSEARMGGYGVRLLKAFERWPENRKVLEVSFGVNSEYGHSKIERFASRIGHSKVGTNFVKYSVYTKAV